VSLKIAHKTGSSRAESDTYLHYGVKMNNNNNNNNTRNNNKHNNEKNNACIY
jgi:hypothetical protein